MSSEEKTLPPRPVQGRSVLPGELQRASPSRGEGAVFNIGLLGHGTVGSAFQTLLEERADHIASLTGRRPSICGVLTRSTGSFTEILDSSELIVEVMGGIEPAREHVLEAMAASRHVVTANKQLLSQSGEELFDAARSAGVQLRFEASVAGVVPVIRVLSESLAPIALERVHGIVNGTTNFILTEMERGLTYAQALAEAQRRGFAEADPSDDVSGRDAAAKMAIIARLAFGTPIHIDQVPYEGIEHLHEDDLTHARELGLVLKLLGSAELRDGGLSVRVDPVFLYGTHPLASISGPFNAVTVEAEAITEITMSGPGAGGRQTAAAILGDVISVMYPPATPPPPARAIRIVEDVESSYYLHMEVADRPSVLASVARVLGEEGASIKSVLQRGMGDNARLVMVIHPITESRINSAVKKIGGLDFMRSTPRALRVIEEDFT